MSKKQQNKKSKKALPLSQSCKWSICFKSPNLKQRATNKHIFEILKKLSQEEGKSLGFYLKGEMDICNGQKLIKRMVKDKLVQVKKGNGTNFKELYFQLGGKECLALLLQQNSLKE